VGCASGGDLCHAIHLFQPIKYVFRVCRVLCFCGVSPTTIVCAQALAAKQARDDAQREEMRAEADKLRKEAETVCTMLRVVVYHNMW
jgi:hypothetical protein